MKKISLLIILLISAHLVAQKQNAEISEKLLKSYVKYLASDKLEGRGTGTAGQDKAAAYITGILEKTSGIVPKGSRGFFHDFKFKYNKNPHDTTGAGAEEKTGMNIVAYLDNAAENTVIIGAHYDHLGMGHDHNSMEANPEGKIHNGADDNASGSAGLLELARHFAGNKRKEAFNFLFIWFSGEELGLFGSKKYCENPTIDFSKVNYMINLDMIGRLNDSTKKLLVHGVGTSPAWGGILDKVKSDFSFKYDSAGIGPSDHTSFYLKDLPVIFFFTGQHKDYHKPTDDWDKLNYPGEKKVLNLVINLVSETEKLPKLTFTKTKTTEVKSVKYKVTMGIMPDYTFDGKGVHVDGVTDGRPAAGAGVKKDDVIIQLGDITIENMQDYMKALGAMEKGNTYPLKVIRAGKETELKVTF